ncbi:response regulator [Aerophototrophica crusticola]|uniref:Response regulator n=1 Tax=Aerophototrophica crusticola TaxID=1709002 RepID=A0A858R6D3_9PROT|nr:response regulator [Rhodospirillaceae bacterium B3]
MHRLDRPSPGLKILICEDEAIIALGLEQMLLAMGHQVCDICATADDAVEAAGRDRPDVVLMDVMLRGEPDGIEAALQIRQRFGIPSLIMTAVDAQAVRERAAAAKPIGFLAKPYRVEDLRHRLYNLMAL